MTRLDANGLTEQEYIERVRKKNYPKPSVTTDIVVFTRMEGKLCVLLIKRKGHPFIGQWATPGGHLDQGETVETCAARELREETGVSDVDPKLIGVYSKPGRDPRGWYVSIAYRAEVDREKITVEAGDDAKEAAWFAISQEGDAIRLARMGCQSAESADPSGDTQGDASGDVLTVTPGHSDLAFDHGEILMDALGC